MKRALVVVMLIGCSSSEPSSTIDASVTESGTDASFDVGRPDVATDSAAPSIDAAGDTAQCCPIGDRGCCMLFGGSRADNPSCGMVCDMIPTDLEVRVDDAGCQYWYDPPGGSTTCNPGGPPDTASD